jgi:hypothetical protein
MIVLRAREGRLGLPRINREEVVRAACLVAGRVFSPELRFAPRS